MSYNIYAANLNLLHSISCVYILHIYNLTRKQHWVLTLLACADHQFYHKWAVLLDPRDTAAGPKGYVKCDLAVCERGVTIRVNKL